MATNRDAADPYLNPSPEENRTPEFGRDSRGWDEDRSWIGRTAGEGASNVALGSLFDGLGNLLGLKVKVEDNFFKNRIDEEVTAAVDLQRDAEILSLGGTSPRVNKETVPDLLVQELKKADSLTAAKRAGSVRDPYYWNRMDVIARETRQRYPGHREYIDQKISSMLGTTPANALVRELQARQSAASSQTDKDREHWERYLLEKTTLGPAYMAAKAKGTPWSTDQMKAEGTSWTARKLAVEQERDGLALEESRGRSVEVEAERVGRETANNVMHDTVKPFTGPDSEFGKLTETMRQTAQRGELINPQDEAKARALLIQARTNSIAAVEAEGNRIIKRPDGTSTTLKTMMGQEKWNNVTKLAETQLRSVEDAYNNKDYNLLQHNLAYMTSITNTAKGRLLTQNEHALLYNTLKEVLGPQGADRYFGQDPGQFSAFVKSTQGEALLKMFEGLVPAKDIQSQFQKVVGEKNPEAIRGQIDTVVRTMKDPATPDRGVVGLANSFFGPGNHGHIAQMDAASQHDMYLKLTDPGIAKRLYDMRSQYPNIWRNYQNWSTDTFLALNNKDLNDAKTIVLNRKNLELGWDWTTSQFRLATIAPTYDPRLSPELQWAAQDLEKNLQKGSAEVVTRLNKSLEGIKSQMILEGRDPNKEIPRLLQSRIGLDISAPKQGSGPENLFLGIQSIVNQVLGGTPEERKAAGIEDAKRVPKWSPGRSNYRLPGEVGRAGLSDLALQERTRMLQEELRGATQDVLGDLGEGAGRFANPAVRPAGAFLDANGTPIPALSVDEQGDIELPLGAGFTRTFGDTPADVRMAAEREESDEVERGIVQGAGENQMMRAGIRDITRRAANDNASQAQVDEMQQMLRDQIKAGLGGGPIAKMLEGLIKDTRGPSKLGGPTDPIPFDQPGAAGSSETPDQWVKRGGLDGLWKDWGWEGLPPEETSKFVRDQFEREKGRPPKNVDEMIKWLGIKPDELHLHGEIGAGLLGTKYLEKPTKKNLENLFKVVPKIKADDKVY